MVDRPAIGLQHDEAIGSDRLELPQRLDLSLRIDAVNR